MDVQIGKVEDVVLARMRSEYHEMPGLKLTERQACRLFGLDAPSCDTLLEALVEAGFLRRAADGRFVRADSRP
jgi:DNA-binding IclR family transcriptional regulator